MARYRVASKHRVCGHGPGAEFEADLPEVQAARLLASGHLEIVPDSQADDGAEEAAEEE